MPCIYYALDVEGMTIFSHDTRHYARHSSGVYERGYISGSMLLETGRSNTIQGLRTAGQHARPES